MSGIINIDPASLVDAVKGIVDRVWPDKTQAEKDELDRQLKRDLGQMAINQAEAAQPGTHFRDGAGWVCVAGFALDVVLRPVATWAGIIFGHPFVLPSMDGGQLTTMLLALLGLGGMHVYQQQGKP